MISGLENEITFVNYLDGKIIGEIHPLFRELFYQLYGKLQWNDRVICWKNPFRQKTDIFIKINGTVKRISLKKGIKNSIHVDAITEFIHFLLENDVPRDIVISYLHYHYADGTTNGKGKYRMSVEEYKKEHSTEISAINRCFNQEKLLRKAIDRFILLGNNSEDKIDTLIHGEVNDFIWLTRDEIIDLILSKNDVFSSGVHFGPLSCQPQDRCLNRNPKYESKRFCVQLKWYNMCDDIIEYRNELLLKKNNLSIKC